MRALAWQLLSATLLALGGCGGAENNGSGNPDAAPPAECKQLCTPLSLTRLDLVAGQPGGRGFVDGPSPIAHFVAPWGLASDGSNRVYITDGGNTIRTLDLQAGSVSTLAGTPTLNGGQDGIGTAASFYGLTSIVARAGILYVADTENHTLRRIDAATGAVSTLAGAYQMGGAVDGPLLAARFQEPEGLALAGDVLYIGDTDNHTIRALSLSTGMVSTVAGLARVPGLVNATGGAARFNKPKAVAVNDSGSLFVLDTGNLCVRQVELASGAVSTLATFTVEPQGIVVVGTDVVVALVDHRIVRLAVPGGTLTELCGKEGASDYVDGACAEARLSNPAGLAADGQGGLYVADGNSVIRKVDLAKGTLSTAAGAKSSGSSDGIGAAARFRGPQGLAADSSGVLYVADTSNYTLRKVVIQTGEVSTLAGAAGQQGKVDAVGADARFGLPAGITLDGEGRLYVADASNHVIRVVDLASARVTTLGALMFRTPADVAIYNGSLYVTDREDHTVSAIELATLKRSTLAGRPLTPGREDGIGDAARLYGPSGLVTDGHGNLYIADDLNQSVRKLVIATGELTTLAGRGAEGGDQAGFSYPNYVAMNGLGDLLVSDVNNNMVRRVALDTGAVTRVIGDPQLFGVRLGALPGQLSSLTGIAMTADGHLALLAEDAVLLAH